MDNGESSYRRFLCGDESAFVEIMDDYRPGLIFFLNRYMQDWNAAEDIAIQVFTDVLIHPHRYNFRASLKTYLYMLGRSKALNCIKHNKAIQTAPLSEAANLPSGELLPEDAVLQDERRRIVNAALERLPEEMRIAVHLVYFENLSYKDAAKVMKKNAKQVDNLLYRAKAELRSILGKEGELLI